MSRARRSFVSSVLLAFLASLFFARAGAAQTVNVTHGFVDGRTGNYDAPVVISGDRGFSFTTVLNFRDKFVGPQDCNDNPGSHCKPGDTMSLSTTTNFSGGTATLDGATYRFGSGVDAKGAMYLHFDGSLTLPPLAPTAIMTTSFTFEGNFNYNTGSSSVSAPLTGHGTAVVYLHSPSNPYIDPPTWGVSRVTFVFQQNTPLLSIDTDIGAVGQAGFAGYDTTDGKYRVTGSGSDIWGAADAFHFHAIDLYNQYGVATVKVDGISDTNTFAKAGLMLRNGLAPDDPHILLDVRPNGGIEFMQRSAVGANTQFIAGGSTTFPVWLRLIHAPPTVTPQNVTAQISNDGTHWQTIGSTASQCCWLAGLAVTSHDDSAIAGAVFEFPQLDIDWPVRDYEVSETGQQGYAWLFNGRYTIVGGGADIWGTRDTYNYLPIGGPSGLVARVLSLENTNTYAKAGVRMDLSDGHNVILDVRPTGDIEFMARPSSGASMQFIAGAVHTFPVWLKIVDSGGVVTGSISSDGRNWTEVGSVSVDTSARILSSLAVTSHDTSKYTTAAFDHVAGVDAGVSPPPPAPDIVVYANDVPTDAIHGVFAKTSDATSPNSIALTTPAGGAAQPNNPLSSPADYVDVTFNANADVPYTMWIRVKAAANSKLSDSLWAQFSDAKVSGTLVYDIGGTSGLLVNLATDSTASSLHNWGWANGAYWLAQPATVSFNSAGSHTLRIQPREYGVMLDQIVLSPSRFLNAGAHCPNSCGGAPGPLSNDTTIVPKP